MRAGKLRHRVEVQENRYTTQDAHGAPVTEWTTFAVVWAAIEPMGGSEAMVANQVNAAGTHKVTIRGGTTVTPKHRVRTETRVFDVNAVTDTEERGRETILACTEAK